MIEKIIISGAGGQGVMLLGKVLAEAAMRENKFVTWMPSYGAEVRGGTSHCMIIISDTEIGSPVVGKADTLIALNAPSLERFVSRVKKNGLLVLNSSLAGAFSNKSIMVSAHPFTQIASELGNIKVANMAALGNYLSQKRIIGRNTVSGVISDIAPADKKDLVAINQKALEEGFNLK